MQLARQFGVPSGTVREALRELESNGVLKRERSSIAAGVSRALALHDVTYHDIWEALTALEPPIATAQKHIAAAIRERDSVQAAEWMAKHILDFRRGFELANIGLQQPVGSA